LGWKKLKPPPDLAFSEAHWTVLPTNPRDPGSLSDPNCWSRLAPSHTFERCRTPTTLPLDTTTLICCAMYSSGMILASSIDQSCSTRCASSYPHLQAHADAHFSTIPRPPRVDVIPVVAVRLLPTRSHGIEEREAKVGRKDSHRGAAD
jgi:hypothetical protein